VIRSKYLVRILTTVLLFDAVISNTAGAQAATEASDAPSTGAGGDLTEVIVTARRTSENLQVVPITVTALTAADIREKNITAPEDFQLTVPGLSTEPAYLARASTTYTLRGQGQVLGGGDPAVAVYFDDVPTNGSGPGFIFDLANIEVLKGPQGTLFGKNSTGGAVLLVPQRPTKEFGGYVDVTNGNYALRRYQVALNVPLIGDVLLARFAMDANHRDGYTTNPTNGEQYDDTNYQGFRLGVTFRPNDIFESYFLAHYAYLNEGGPGMECLHVNPAGAITDFAGLVSPCLAQQAYGPRRVNLWVPPAGNYIRTWNGAVDDTTTIKLSDNIELKNILGYRIFLQKQSYTSYAGTPFPLFEIIGNPYYSASYGLQSPSNKTVSDEIQLHGDSFQHRLHWTTGLYFDTVSPHSNEDRDWATGLLLGGHIQSNTALRHSRSKAVYGQATYDITDKLNITVGARYTRDVRDQLANQYIPDLQTCVVGATPAYQLGPAQYCNVYSRDVFSAPTWNASIQYQVTPETMVFFTSRRGYKSGGFNAVAPTPQEFGPEHTTDFELGEKSEFRLGDVKGRINASIFRSHFDNWQQRILETLETQVGSQPFALITNTATGNIEGLEVEATILVSKHLELSGFYAYTDGYFTKNVFHGVDYTSTPVSNLVKHKGSLTAKYLIAPSSKNADISLSATYAYTTKRNGALNTEFIRNGAAPDPYSDQGAVPAYGLLNLRADWTHVMGYPLDLGVFVDNATNKLYFTYYGNSWSTGFDQGEYGPPRMFGVSARWNF
jgi:iron complex outermembrane recepter protein